MTEKMHKTYRYLKFAVLVFQPIILLQLLLNYDVIVINRFFKPLTPEYLTWYLNSGIPAANEMYVTGISYILNILFLITFLLGIICILSNDVQRKLIGKKRIFISVGITLAVFAMIYLLIRYVAVHYRLYMDFLPAEVLGILVWSFIGKSASSDT